MEDQLLSDVGQLLRQFTNPPAPPLPPPPPVDNVRAHSDDARMEARVSALEQANLDTRDRLTRIETRMDSLATKEDLHKETHSQTWRIIGVAALLVAVVYYFAKYVH
jgi:hypothetical protein